MPRRLAAPRSEEDPPQGRKNVAHGHSHIKSTFNTPDRPLITDPMGNVIIWASGRPRRLQGLAQ